MEMIRGLKHRTLSLGCWKVLLLPLSVGMPVSVQLGYQVQADQQDPNLQED